MEQFDREVEEVLVKLGIKAGTVTGPATHADAKVPQWDGEDTKALKEGLSFLDEDDMASDSATALATQQSIKAFVDNHPINGGTF